MARASKPTCTAITGVAPSAAAWQKAQCGQPATTSTGTAMRCAGCHADDLAAIERVRARKAQSQ